MVVVGLNAYHADSSAALVIDDKLIAAAEEERFKRIKHWAGFPRNSIEYCLRAGAVQLSDVDIIAINTDKKSSFYRKLLYLLTGRARLDLIKEKLEVRRKRRNVIDDLWHANLEGFKGRLEAVEHHLAHLASAFMVSPFDEAVVLSVDGFGDFSSCAWGVGVGDRIDIKQRVHFPHSLGVFYQAMTQYLGFKRYGDEYKVMGLASYGKPLFSEQVRDIVKNVGNGGFELNLKYFTHHQSKAGFEWRDSEPVMDDLFSTELEALLGERRAVDGEVTEHHMNVASSVQSIYEEVYFTLLNQIHRDIESSNLSLSGGCAMNSVANGKIYKHTNFRRVFVHPAAGDAGGAVGAALMAVARHGGDARSNKMEHAFWGPQFDDEAIQKDLEVFEKDLSRTEYDIEHVNDVTALLQKTAQAIADGDVVGWFHGRMEWGPRALGARSILCDPRRYDMKDILNHKIKRRESFRPFAPSILREAVPDWFETDDDVPFMSKVFEVRPEKRTEIPAVTHVDGTGRLQTVNANSSPRYYGLIKAFSTLTGVPILLNTSFNENEPIVCRPREALDCFIRTRMDMLVLGNFVLRRTNHA